MISFPHVKAAHLTTKCVESTRMHWEGLSDSRGKMLIGLSLVSLLTRNGLLCNNQTYMLSWDLFVGWAVLFFWNRSRIKCPCQHPDTRLTPVAAAPPFAARPLPHLLIASEASCVSWVYSGRHTLEYYCSYNGLPRRSRVRVRIVIASS